MKITIPDTYFASYSKNQAAQTFATERVRSFHLKIEHSDTVAMSTNYPNHPSYYCDNRSSRSPANGTYPGSLASPPMASPYQMVTSPVYQPQVQNQNSYPPLTYPTSQYPPP